MKFQVLSLHGKWDINSERNTQKLASQQSAEVCRVLECNSDFYKNAVHLYKMYRRADKFSNRVSEGPK